MDSDGATGIGTSSLGLVARIRGVSGGVGTGEWPADEARLTTEDGTDFHGEPVGARVVFVPGVGESGGSATGLRWGVRQLGVSDAADGWRG